MSALGSEAGEPARFTSPDWSVMDTVESATAAPAWPAERIGAAPRARNAASATATRRGEAAGMSYLRKTRGPSVVARAGPSVVARAPAWGLSGVYRLGFAPNRGESGQMGTNASRLRNPAGPSAIPGVRAPQHPLLLRGPRVRARGVRGR